MDDMLAQITQILNDPERMKEITDIASTLGFSQVNTDDFSTEMREQRSNAVHSIQKKDEKQQALVRALLPYLRPKHQKKLEQAIRFVQLTHVAGASMQNRKQDNERKEELNDL